MNDTKDKSSIWISIFKRKGGEGLFTKIITDQNRSRFPDQLSHLGEGEKPLLCYRQDDSNWLLISNKRILQERSGSKLSLSFADLRRVGFAFREELHNNILSKSEYTRIAVTDNSGKTYILQIEKGEPFKGVFQMLHYIVASEYA